MRLFASLTLLFALLTLPVSARDRGPDFNGTSPDSRCLSADYAELLLQYKAGNVNVAVVLTKSRELAEMQYDHANVNSLPAMAEYYVRSCEVRKIAERLHANGNGTMQEFAQAQGAAFRARALMQSLIGLSKAQ